MKEQRNNSGDEKRSAGDKNRKELVAPENDLLFGRKNYKDEFFNLREGEHKKREIVEDAFSVGKKIKENNMEEKGNFKETEKPINDKIVNIDVNEYTYTIDNVCLSDEEEVEGEEEEEEETETVGKTKDKYEEYNEINKNTLIDTNNFKGDENNKSIPTSMYDCEYNNSTNEIGSISETVKQNVSNDKEDLNRKINLKKYVYVKLKVNDAKHNVFKCRIEKCISVKRLKHNLKKLLNANYLRIIYRGRSLKDMDKLSQYDIKVNDTIFVIKLNDKRGSGSGMDSGISSSQLSTLKDTDDIQKFEDNGNLSNLLSSMFDHGDFFKSLMDSNEQLKKLRDKMPEINHLLNDSQAIKQSIDVMKNPSLMKELMRNTDRAISNIEAIPGGFNALSRMYHTFQEPMYSMMDKLNDEKKNSVKYYDLQSTTAPTKEAFPNPWAPKKRDPNYFLLSPEDGKKKMLFGGNHSKSKNASKNKKMDLNNMNVNSVFTPKMKDIMENFNLNQGNIFSSLLNDASTNSSNTDKVLNPSFLPNNLPPIFPKLFPKNGEGEVSNVLSQLKKFGDWVIAMDKAKNNSGNQPDALPSNSPNICLENTENRKQNHNLIVSPNNNSSQNMIQKENISNKDSNNIQNNGSDNILQNELPNQMNNRPLNAYSNLFNTLFMPPGNGLNHSLNKATENQNNNTMNSSGSSTNNSNNNNNGAIWPNQNKIAPFMLPPNDILYENFPNAFQEILQKPDKAGIGNSQMQKTIEESTKLLSNLLGNVGLRQNMTTQEMAANIPQDNTNVTNRNATATHNNIMNGNKDAKDQKVDNSNNRDQQVFLESMNFFSVDDDKDLRDKEMNPQCAGMNNYTNTKNADDKESSFLTNDPNKNMNKVVIDSNGIQNKNGDTNIEVVKENGTQENTNNGGATFKTNILINPVVEESSLPIQNSPIPNSTVTTNNITNAYTSEQNNNKNIPNNVFTSGLNQLNNMNLKGLADTIKLLSYGSNNMNETNLNTIYAQQLNSLKLMGFTDTQKCIKALADTQGNIERAIDKLLDDSNGNQN